MEKTIKEDLRVQRTKEAIHNTFEQMICEMDFEKITIKELTERARINRKTFYLHYPTLDALLVEVQNKLKKGYLERIAEFKIPEDLDKITSEFFLYSEEQGEFYERITCSGSYQYIRQQMINDVMNRTWKQADKVQQLDTYKRNILISYQTASTLEIYKQWISDGKKIPVDEIIKIADQLVCQ